MRERQGVRVGALEIVGGEYRFVPAPAAQVELGHGGEAEVQLTYTYTEASSKKEEMLVRFQVEVPGKPAMRTEARATDTPGMPNEQWGTLRHVVKGLPPGVHRAKFLVEAVTTTSGWLGGQKQSQRFQKAGEFLIHVA